MLPPNKSVELMACRSRFFVKVLLTRHLSGPQLTSTLGKINCMYYSAALDDRSIPKEICINESICMRK